MPLIDRILFPAGEERRLAFVQRALAAAIAVRVGLGPYRHLAGQPEELWRPRGVTLLLGSMPPEPVIVGLQVAGAVAALWVAFAPAGRRGRRPAFAVAWVSLLILAGLRTSLGKIFHNDLLLILAAVPLMWSSFSARLDGTRRSPAFGWPVAVATAVVVSAYFFSGYQKVLHSGPAWVLSDNMANVMAWGAASARAPTEAIALALAGSWWASRVAAAGLLGVELLSPMVLFRSRLRPWLAVAAVAIHVVGWLTLGLDYWAWIAVDLAVLVDWPATMGLRRRWWPVPLPSAAP